jgi:hypothetical protein
MYGSVRSQLMQVYVQKSTTTTFPRSAAGVRGWEFSHPVAPASEGNPPPSDMPGVTDIDLSNRIARM